VYTEEERKKGRAKCTWKKDVEKNEEEYRSSIVCPKSWTLKVIGAFPTAQIGGKPCIIRYPKTKRKEKKSSN